MYVLAFAFEQKLYERPKVRKGLRAEHQKHGYLME